MNYLIRLHSFKKKGKSKDSFYIGGDQFRLRGNYVKIPKLGWVRMRECLRFDGKSDMPVSVPKTSL